MTTGSQRVLKSHSSTQRSHPSYLTSAVTSCDVCTADVTTTDSVGQSVLLTRVLADSTYECRAVNEVGTSDVQMCFVTAVKQETRTYYCHCHVEFSFLPALENVSSLRRRSGFSAHATLCVADNKPMLVLLSLWRSPFINYETRETILNCKRLSQTTAQTQLTRRPFERLLLLRLLNPSKTILLLLQHRDRSPVHDSIIYLSIIILKDSA